MKKMKYLVSILMIGLLTGLPFLGFFLSIPIPSTQTVGGPEAPITARAWQEGMFEIASNADLIAYNVSAGADGSAGNPYVIANLTINATEETGIYIHDTTAHFILENCTVINARCARASTTGTIRDRTRTRRPDIIRVSARPHLLKSAFMIAP